MKTFLLFSFTLITFLSGCNSSKTDIPKDFQVIYSNKSYLIKFETTIDLTGDHLKLYYTSSSPEKTINGIFTAGEKDINSIYDFIEQKKLMKMKSPEPEKLLDAPEENFTITISGKTNSIDFGSVKEKPSELLQLKNMLFDLAEKYKPGWKKETGME
jgi:hypothetical protein